MRKVFDIAVQYRQLEQLLNDDKFFIEEIDISCSEKTGYSCALVRYKKNKFPEKRKWKRRIRRFLLIDGGENEMLNKIIADKDFRIVEEYDFKFENGVIIIIDFEERGNKINNLKEEDVFFEEDEVELEIEDEENNGADDIIQALEKQQLQAAIDKALANDDEKLFLKLTEQLNKLNNNKS